MAIAFTNIASANMMEALKSKDEAKIQEAWDGFRMGVINDIKADFEEYMQTQDMTVLAQRGYRQLTSQENKFYEALSGALKSANPKQAFTELIGSDMEDELMPTTIFQDVYKDLEEEHPLLAKVGFQYVGYITKWIMNDHAAQRAVWGPINSAITEEITSSFKVMEIKQAKLSCYALIELDMLELGPTFLDAYIRRCLKEAMACGLEHAMINGTGVNEPIGLLRDIHEGVSFNTETGYPLKEKVAVKSFAPAEYGPLVARMAVKENGHKRRFGSVALIVNQNDYLTKVMPATTVQNVNGQFVNNLFPFPTDVIVSNEMKDGEACLCLLPEYGMFAGGKRGETIDFSDDFKFLEDTRYFKVKQFATGRAWDNTCALYLDISGLEPAYITVKNMETTVTA